MLSETRKADRAKMAAAVEKLCANMGANSWRREYDRKIVVEIEFGEARVAVDFDGGSFNLQPNVFCMPWNIRCGRQFEFTSAFGRMVGAEVNPFHRRKCCGFADGFNDLMIRLRAAMDCIADGRATIAREA